MKRSTVYLEEDLHKALKLKSADTDVAMSTLVNDAIRESLFEDAGDLQAFDERKNEPSIDFETFVQSLKKDGKI